MQILTFLSFQVGALAVLLLLVISIMLMTTRGYLRFALVGLFAISLPIIYLSFSGLLGEGKPLLWEKDELRHEAQVLAYEVQDDFIFLWLRLPDRTEPRYYVMDYDSEKAKQMAEAKRDAGQRQTNMVMQLLPKNHFDYEVLFYAQPQKPYPLKDYEMGRFGGSPY